MGNATGSVTRQTKHHNLALRLAFSLKGLVRRSFTTANFPNVFNADGLVITCQDFELTFTTTPVQRQCVGFRRLGFWHVSDVK